MLDVPQGVFFKQKQQQQKMDLTTSHCLVQNKINLFSFERIICTNYRPNIHVKNNFRFVKGHVSERQGERSFPRYFPMLCLLMGIFHWKSILNGLLFPNL